MKGRVLLWKARMSENASYKVVALFVSLVLWLTMMHRRDAVVTRELDLQFLLNPNYAITNQLSERVQVQLSGGREAVRRFSQSEDTFTVDLSRLKPGRHVVKLSQEGLDLPMGVKVLSIEPGEVTADIVEVNKSPEDAEKE